MKGLILSAGYGTRLRPVTYFKPKGLVKIAGISILERLINYLNYFGVNEIFINLHYKPDQIMKAIGLRAVYLYELKLLGEEGTIKSLNSYLKNDWCVVMNGDTLTNVNLNKMFSMSGGKNIKFMDGDTYAGVRIIEPGYKEGDRSILYQDAEAWWIDMGTFEGLKKANLRLIEERRERLSRLS